MDKKKKKKKIVNQGSSVLSLHLKASHWVAHMLCKISKMKMPVKNWVCMASQLQWKCVDSVAS